MGEQGGAGGGDGSRREGMRIIRGGGRPRVISYFALSCLINTRLNKVIKVALWTRRECSSSSSGSRCRPKSGKLLERCWVPSRRRSWPTLPRLEGWRRGRGKRQRRWNIYPRWSTRTLTYSNTAYSEILRASSKTLSCRFNNCPQKLTTWSSL